MIKYKNKKFSIIYCDYENFRWYCAKIKGSIILYINNKYSQREKSKIIHYVIRNSSLFYIFMLLRDIVHL